MNETKRRPDRLEIGLLLAIVFIAAVLRLGSLDRAPPGIHVDAAANAWNSWCMSETGRDWHRDAWPIFYSKAFGENRTTLFFYFLMPFQKLGGLSVVTTRLPNATAGIVTVLLTWFIGRRLFCRWTGLLASLLLSISPWHLLLSRHGHEAGLVPLLVCLPLAGVLLIVVDRNPPTIGPGLVAGLVSGICMYGYYSVRLFLPAFLVTAFVCGGSIAKRYARSRSGRWTLATFGAGLAVTAGPLFLVHLIDPATTERARQILLWDGDRSLVTNAAAVAARYVEHFSIDFLFRSGDGWPLNSVPGWGVLPSYLMPLMAVGLVIAIARSRRSFAARVLLVWILLYPAADCFSSHDGPHALRSSPGLVGLVLLGAYGAVASHAWLRSRQPHVARTVAVVVLLLVMAWQYRFFGHFYGRFNAEPIVYQAYNADMMEAYRRVLPRFGETDALLVTTTGTGALDQDFILALVGLKYDPNDWMEDDIRTVERNGREVISGFGRVRLLYPGTGVTVLDELRGNGETDRVTLILRPGELGLQELPVETIVGPDGRTMLHIHEKLL